MNEGGQHADGLERWAAFFPSRPNQYSIDLQIEAKIEPNIEGSKVKLKVQYIGSQLAWEPIQEIQFYSFLYDEIGRSLRKHVLPVDTASSTGYTGYKLEH